MINLSIVFIDKQIDFIFAYTLNNETNVLGYEYTFSIGFSFNLKIDKRDLNNIINEKQYIGKSYSWLIFGFSKMKELKL